MIFILSSILMCGAAVVLVELSKTIHAAAKKSNREVEEFDPLKARQSPWAIPVVINYLSRLGLTLRTEVTIAIIGSEAAIAVILLLLQPFKIAMLATAIMLTLTHLVLQTIGGNQKKKLLQSLPSFLNQVARRLSSGVSVEHAFTDSMENIDGPLELAMKRVMQRVGLGLELYQAFEREARANSLKELLIISTALHINDQFGGSIRSILDDIVQILRLDDLGKRELKAQTGETRITAMVLTLLPIAMIGLLLSKNPMFLSQMWSDGLGQTLLVTAAILQCVGAFSLWRMVRVI
ncbi:MAG: tight adherence protein B [Bermanella sp.]|jgi:tight adherence protein B